MNISDKKCELCSMIATHTVTDAKNVTHHFCEHHSLKDITTTEHKSKSLLPLFVVFLFVTLLSLVRQFLHGTDVMMWMMDFMGIFFLTFGLFKLYDLKGFALGFRTYDVIAKKIPQFGYVYPFIEIAIGVTYLAGMMFFWQTILVLALAGAGLYSAYVVVFRDKEEIQCVCLGTFFALPMTYVTLLENGLMFAMALFMLLM